MTWKIVSCEHDIATGGITAAHWSLTLQDGDFSASNYGCVYFSPDPSSSNFVAYDKVTEQQVFEWIWANGVNKEANESSVMAEIQAKKNPTHSSGLPWVKEEVPQ